jgi:hypothetical protein
MKTKKAKIITGITVLTLLTGSFGVYKVLNNVSNYEKKQSAIESRLEDEQESEEQTAYIGGIEFETGLTNKSYELDVINVMHKMTHQKVRSEDKWGAVPMTLEIINEVISVIESNNYDNKDDLLRIAKKWKDHDYEDIVQDHNYFWALQDGTIGEAYGILSATEEEEFIKNNFK